MKVYEVEFPFEIDTDGRSRWCCPSVNQAKRVALDEFVTQEELEDEESSTSHLSKQPAKVYEVEVQLKRSVITSILNGETPSPKLTKTLVHEFRYRRGKIVVTNVKAATETEKVG